MKSSYSLACGAIAVAIVSGACAAVDDAGGGASGEGAGGASGLGGNGGQAGYAGENFPPPPPPPVCGDGQARSPEQCDDANTAPGDGCSASCTVEAGWSCPSDGCYQLWGDRACSAAACGQGATCVERPSGLGCACPSPMPGACEGLRFRALGLLADSDSCSASALSQDGSTVVGSCTRSEQFSGITKKWAYRWSLGGGTQPLALPPDHYAEALATSSDGAIIIGYESELPFGYPSPFRVASGQLSPSPAGLAGLIDLSADGSVVLGTASIVTDAGLPFVPSLWTSSGVTPLASVGPDADPTPTALSADGSVVVGSATADGVLHAVRWDPGGFTLLPLPPGGIESEARGVSADGAVIVGNVFFADLASHVARWTPNGVEDLGPGSGADVSADGSVITAGPLLWDEAHGLRRLADILTETGTDLSGWAELYAGPISGDGKVVAGSAQYLGVRGISGFRAFVVWLP
jgi:cysteine-rich repeat protein